MTDTKSAPLTSDFDKDAIHGYALIMNAERDASDVRYGHLMGYLMELNESDAARELPPHVKFAAFVQAEEREALRDDAERVHVMALELHADFLFGVQQAEKLGEKLGEHRPLFEMSDTLLSDELLWARSELAKADRSEWMAGCALRLTMLRLERDARRQAPTLTTYPTEL